MEEQQLVVLVLAAVVFVFFTIEFVGSLRDYATRPKGDRRRPRWAVRLRDVIKSFVLWLGVASILAGRVIAAFVADPDARRLYGLVAGAAITGALLLGGAFLAWTRLRDHDEVVA